jgi:phosphoglycerate dehydrogenase-like enzyme
MAQQERIRVAVGGPLADELVQRIVEREPRVEILIDQSLLPPQRHPGDHAGDPAFERSPEQQRRYEELLNTADVLYGIPGEQPALLKRVVDTNPRLRWVHTTPAGGGSQVKAAGLTEEQLDRIAFTTSAGVHVEPLAEFSLLGLLAGLKTLPRLQDHQRRHEWASDRWPMRLLGDSAVLVVGLGHIGRTTAGKLAALGVRVAGTSRRDVQVEGVREVIHPDALADRIGEFDGIVVTLPGTDQTEHLVSAEVLAAVKPRAVVVNVGRGSVIEESALVRELQSGRIAFAALDVVENEPLDPDSPLWDMPNVLISPHTAAMNEREDGLIADLFAENATRFLDGRELINRVNTVEFY